MEKILIKRGLKIGALDAESDINFLNTCFVNNGQIDDFLNISSHASIVIGRTGAGKSALLYKISQEVEHSKLIDLNDVSIRFLEHSNIIQFFNELDIKLDLFYRALWKHILTVELLKLRFNLKTESDSRKITTRFSNWVSRDSIKKTAIDYFSEWNDKFWLESDEQLKELTKKLANDISASFKKKYGNLEISLEGAKSLGEEERTEIRSLATRYVSSIQIQKLNKVWEMLASEEFTDQQKRYYILIDKLDEDWAETNTRCRFIRALIEETKAFRRVSQVKIITALRQDLLELVFDKTRESGFQEEKYDAYLIPLQWEKRELREIISARVKEVYRRQYSSKEVNISDVFVKEKTSKYGDPIDYILDRTLKRPRDAIQFCNECFSVSTEKQKVGWRSIKAAESKYSSQRLKSLTEEWGEKYPALDVTFEILRGIDIPFKRSDLSDRLQDISIDLHGQNESDPCVKIVKAFYETNSKIKESEIISTILMCLYHVGLIGIKISTNKTFIWSYLDQATLSKSEAKRVNQIKVHKMFHQALEINNKK